MLHFSHVFLKFTFSVQRYIRLRNANQLLPHSDRHLSGHFIVLNVTFISNPSHLRHPDSFVALFTLLRQVKSCLQAISIDSAPRT